MFMIQNVHKSYGKTEVIKGATLAIKDRSIYGIVGPASSGKTTIAKILSGLLRVDAGTVEINGENILDIQKPISDLVGYMSQELAVYNDLTVIEYLNYFMELYEMKTESCEKQRNKILKLVGLHNVTDEVVENLSRGMKRRLCLARCLLNNPKYLVLDEPFKEMDPCSKEEFKDLLRKLNADGKTIIIATGSLDEVENLCTKVSILGDGRVILSGSFTEIISNIRDSSKLIIQIVEGKETAVELLKRNNYVERIAVEKKSISISFKGNRYMEAVLLKELVEHHVLIASFSREKKDYEDVFLQITNSMNGGYDV